MQDISLEKAQELLLREVREIPLSETESVPLLAALGRRLAEDCCAAFDQPPFDRSPLDGYALLAACRGRRRTHLRTFASSARSVRAASSSARWAWAKRFV